MNEQMERLYKAAKEIHGIVGQSALARELNASPQTINNWEVRGVSKQGMLLAQRVFGCSASWIETGIGTMTVGEVQGLIPNTGATGVHVALLANSASMGPGEVALDDDVLLGSITLTQQFVAERIRPTRADALRFIHAYGDSMSPTFNSGDVLLVDTGVREIKIDGIYVLSAHDRLFVKRVRQRLDGKYEISSDNPTYKTVDVLNGGNDVRVIGRVLWAWNGHRM